MRKKYIYNRIRITIAENLRPTFGLRWLSISNVYQHRG